jgi:hypothetical protein
VTNVGDDETMSVGGGVRRQGERRGVGELGGRGKGSMGLASSFYRGRRERESVGRGSNGRQQPLMPSMVRLQWEARLGERKREAQQFLVLHLRGRGRGEEANRRAAGLGAGQAVPRRWRGDVPAWARDAQGRGEGHGVGPMCHRERKGEKRRGAWRLGLVVDFYHLGRIELGFCFFFFYSVIH